MGQLQTRRPRKMTILLRYSGIIETTKIKRDIRCTHILGIMLTVVFFLPATNELMQYRTMSNFNLSKFQYNCGKTKIQLD